MDKYINKINIYKWRNNWRNIFQFPQKYLSVPKKYLSVITSLTQCLCYRSEKVMKSKNLLKLLSDMSVNIFYYSVWRGT